MTLSSGVLPTAAFANAVLHKQTIPAGRQWRRIYDKRHPDPLGFVRTLSRFSDPTGQKYGLVYAGATAKVAFMEAVLRDRAVGAVGDFPLELTELKGKILATIEVVAPLVLADLTGDGCIIMRLPTDVVNAQDHALARVWAEAIHDHPDAVDGVLYPSRLNGHDNIAVFERALGKLGGVATPDLMDCRVEMTDILTGYNLSVI